MIVYQLIAYFDDPFVGGSDTRESTTLFLTKEVAQGRVEKFKTILREVLKVRADYEIRVELKPFEVIQE